MSWKAHCFLNPRENIDDDDEKETFGFNSTRPAPVLDEMKEFKDKLFDLVARITFRPNMKPNELQKKLKKDVELIKSKKEVIIPADKTNNFYALPYDKYSQLMEKNIHKEYKKTDEKTLYDVTQGDKHIADNYDIGDRVYATVKQPCFATIKDHKEDFQTNTKTRLINPMKSEIGKISKQLLSKIVKNVKDKTKLKQWTKTTEVIDHFKDIENKQKASFIQADVENFYPSITEELLSDALTWASQYVEISHSDRKTIFQANKSTLYHKGELWVKKGDSLFDVTMWSYGGAEVCELVGLYFLFKLADLLSTKYKGQVVAGCYRDDVLAHSYIRRGSALGKQLEKDFRDVFSKLGLIITIQSNLTAVNFLDVTFNMEDGSYQPFTKENHVPVYVHVKSNHPPAVIKHLAQGVNARLNTISSDETMFNNNKNIYQQALNNAGYDYNLYYIEKQKNSEDVRKQRKRRRKRNSLFFNPPWNAAVDTNVGKEFLKALDACFPPDHILHPIFNRKNVRVSYSTTKNISRVISAHNSKVAAATTNEVPDRTCNCPKTKKGKPNSCPMGKECLLREVVYCATVTGSQPRPAAIPATDQASALPIRSSGAGTGNPAAAGAGGRPDRRAGGRGGVAARPASTAVPADTAAHSATAQPGAHQANTGEQAANISFQYGTYTGMTRRTFKERLYGHI